MIQALVAALFIAAAPGAAPEAPPGPPSAKAASPGVAVSEAVVTAKPKDDPLKMVCKSETPVGSRLPVKHCVTQGEAAMRQFEDRQQLDRMQGDTYRR